MSVYVDKAKNRYGRMIMCHMLSDSEDELHDMADRIGVHRNWMQRSRRGMIHYDICRSKRDMAIRNGAIEVGRNEVVELIRRAS